MYNTSQLSHLRALINSLISVIEIVPSHKVLMRHCTHTQTNTRTHTHTHTKHLQGYKGSAYLSSVSP